MKSTDKYTIEMVPTSNPYKHYLIKTYAKGGVQTVNQFINGKVFYARWEQYSRASIKYIKEDQYWLV